MRKLKMVMLIIVAVVLAIFAYENRQPAEEIKLFRFQLGEIPQFLVVYLSLVVGAAIGWVGHGLRIRRKRREAHAAQTVSAHQQEESQKGQGGPQAQ
jgi:uncharacterized integral membrane protein